MHGLIHKSFIRQVPRYYYNFMSQCNIPVFFFFSCFGEERALDDGLMNAIVFDQDLGGVGARAAAGQA